MMPGETNIEKFGCHQILANNVKIVDVDDDEDDEDEDDDSVQSISPPRQPSSTFVDYDDNGKYEFNLFLFFYFLLKIFLHFFSVDNPLQLVETYYHNGDDDSGDGDTTKQESKRILNNVRNRKFPQTTKHMVDVSCIIRLFF